MNEHFTGRWFKQTWLFLTFPADSWNGLTRRKFVLGGSTGNLLHSELERSTMLLAGKIHYFDWAIFNSFLYGLPGRVVFPSDLPWTLDMWGILGLVPLELWNSQCSTGTLQLSIVWAGRLLGFVWFCMVYFISIFQFLSISFFFLSLSLSGSLFAYFIPWKDSYSLLAWEAPIFGGNFANFLWIDFPPNQTIDPLNIMFFCWFPDFDGEWSSLLVNFPGLIYHRALR